MPSFFEELLRLGNEGHPPYLPIR
jgi:hypothetical protein